MLTKVKGLLRSVPVYVGLQRVVGADRLRYRCLDELALSPGDCVLDIGCGPAYYFPSLPPKVRYYGFDTDAGYIAHARRRYGAVAEFRAEVFAEHHLAELPAVDAVLLLGVLHHLDDASARTLLSLCARALAPAGRVISVDTCFEPGQGRISRWMSENDRGEYVREPASFARLAGEAFGQVSGEVLDEVTRIPSSFWLMRMSAARLDGGPVGDEAAAPASL